MKIDFKLNLEKLKASYYDHSINNKMHKEVRMNNKQNDLNNKEVKSKQVQKWLKDYLKDNIVELTKKFEKTLKKHRLGYISTILKRTKENKLENEIAKFTNKYNISKELRNKLEWNFPHIHLIDEFNDAIIAYFKKQEIKEFGEEVINERDEVVDALYYAIWREKNDTFSQLALFHDLVDMFQSEEEFAKDPTKGIMKELLKKENREELLKYYYKMWGERANIEYETKDGDELWKNKYLQKALFDKNSRIFLELVSKIEEDLIWHYAPEFGKNYWEYEFEISKWINDGFYENMGGMPFYEVTKNDLKMSEDDFIDKVKKEIEEQKLHLRVLEAIGHKKLMMFVNTYSGWIDEDDVFKQLKGVVLEQAINDREYDLEELEDEEEV